MRYLRAAIIVLLTVSSVSKATVWTYRHFHPAGPSDNLGVPEQIR